MDPRHGELSPAMRNRGVEICIENFDNLMDNSSKEKVDLEVESIGFVAMVGYNP